MSALSGDACVQRFREQILARAPVRIRGGGSKDFYGGPLRGEILNTREFSGIVNYEPSELVVTVRAGTPLAALKSALAGRRQWLPFEPPQFEPPEHGAGTVGGTVGGMVAAGLSGPGRMAAGAVRDFMLGVTIMDGEGRVLKFGGEVMKNVAGFDLSRLMAGSLGTLGLLLEVSIKVLPMPVAEHTLGIRLSEPEALVLMNRWAGQPLPFTATCWHDGVLWLRLAGARAAVSAAQAKLCGSTGVQGAALDTSPEAPADLWTALRDQRAPFFSGDAPLWRIAVPSTTDPLNLGPTLIEWGGGLRWLRGDHDAASLRTRVAALGGHVTRFRGEGERNMTFHPLTPGLLQLHRRLQQRFDPHGVFNPGRLIPEI